MMRLLALLSFALLAVAPAHAAEFDPCRADAREHYEPILKAQAKSKTLLFKVVRCKAKPSYVFGTMHSDDPLIHNRANQVIALLPSLRIAAFEYLEPPEAAAIMQRAMFDPLAVVSLDQQLTKKEWNALGNELVRKRKMPVESLKKMRPWAASVMLQMPKLNHGGEILDDRLKTLSRVKGLQLQGLETLQEQMDIFSGMPQEQQLDMLKDTLSNLWQLDQMNQELFDAYRAGDLPRIERLGEQGFADIQDYDLRHYLKNRLLTLRNQHMAERAEPELTKGSMLIAVGALHLPGKDGVLDRLEQMGFFIFPVTQTP